MKVRVRTAIDGPNRHGKYRALLIVDGKRHSSSPWISEAEATALLQDAHDALFMGAEAHGLTIALNPGHAPIQPQEPGKDKT